MEPQLLRNEILSHYGSAITVCLTLYAIRFLALQLWQARNSNIEYVGPKWFNPISVIPRWQTDALGLMKQGIRTVGLNKPFKVWTMDGDFILLPKSTIPEIKEMAPDKLNFRPEAKLMMMSKYTGAKVDSQWQADSFRISMTRALGGLMPLLEEETTHALNLELPNCDDWTPLVVYPTFLRMVAMIAGRIFVGAPMNRDANWVDMTTHYTSCVLQASYKLKICPPFLRTALSWLLPEIWTIHSTYRTVKGIVKPILRQRLAQESEQGPTYEKPNDLMQWLMDQQRLHEELNLDTQAITLLLASLASQHTTTMAVTQAIFDLATSPEYIAPLREEINEVWEAHDGLPSKQAMLELRRLDSFMKESQRLNPPFAVSMGRSVLQATTLKDGTYLHKDAHIAVPSMALETLDPQIQGPEEFRPFRFYNIWKKNSDEFHHQFTNTATSSQFGSGKNTCPGRFLAAAEIKLLLAYLIRDYDFKLANPELGRPPNLTFEQSFFPNIEGKILLKKI